MGIKTVNLEDKFGTFNDHWNPKIVGELNGQQVKLAKLKGEFVMHQHENEDELFMVIDGILRIELEEETITIQPGEFAIIPRGTLHKPIAENEVKVVLFEPSSTLNTGDLDNELTVTDPEKI